LLSSSISDASQKVTLQDQTIQGVGSDIELVVGRDAEVTLVFGRLEVVFSFFLLESRRMSTLSLRRRPTCSLIRHQADTVQRARTMTPSVDAWARGDRAVTHVFGFVMAAVHNDRRGSGPLTNTSPISTHDFVPGLLFKTHLLRVLDVMTWDLDQSATKERSRWDCTHFLVDGRLLRSACLLGSGAGLQQTQP
jgi:hypothetical protein